MEKNIIHKQQYAQTCEGLACKPGWQESAIGKASLHADDPPICLKCRVCAQLFNIAMLLSVKRRGIISAMVLFYSLSIQS